MDIESSLENNPQYRFIPLGPSSAAGVIAAVFIILLICWLYLAARFHRFLLGSVIRLVVFCLVGAIGYILRIVCNSQIPNGASTSDQINTFINLYIAANTLTSIGNFFLFNALTAVGNAWVESKRSVTETNQIYFERRMYRYFTLATLAALILSIVGSANNNNSLRIASNGIFVGLLVVLLLTIPYYHSELELGDNRRNEPVSTSSKLGSKAFTHPYAIQVTLFVCTLILLAAQAFKLAQSVVPIGTPALQNIALIYIFSPVLNLIILIILTVTWYPVFYATLWERHVAFQRSQTEYLESQNAGGYPMHQPGQYASPPPPQYNASR
ncbi:hypothetical protein Unana1_05608 [Umbelopsis nana]